MIKNLLFVCVGNICRSPMAEALFREKLDNSNIVVSSAGLGALVDKPAAEEAQTAMSSIGIDVSKHRARKLTAEMVRANDLILVMEEWQRKEVINLFPYSRGKIHLIGKWSDFEVPDPYKKSQQDFDLCLELFQQGWQNWQNRL